MQSTVRGNLAIACPITNTVRGFPLHVSLDEQTKTTGVIICEQVKALDPRVRKASEKLLFLKQGYS